MTKQNLIFYCIIIFSFFFLKSSELIYFPQDIWKIIIVRGEKNEESTFALIHSDIYQAIRTPEFFKKIVECELRTQVFDGNFAENEFQKTTYHFLKKNMREIKNIWEI